MLPGYLTSTQCAVCVEKSQRQNLLITGFEHGTFGTRGRCSTSVPLSPIKCSVIELEIEHYHICLYTCILKFARPTPRYCFKLLCRIFYTIATTTKLSALWFEPGSGLTFWQSKMAYQIKADLRQKPAMIHLSKRTKSDHLSWVPKLYGPIKHLNSVVIKAIKKEINPYLCIYVTSSISKLLNLCSWWV